MENIKVSSFKNRLKEILLEKNMTQKELSDLTGITPSSISDWLRGKYEAKQDKIDIIATALNVSQAYLMGYDVPKVNRVKMFVTESNSKQSLTNNQEKIISLFNQLNEEGQEKALSYTQDLVDSGKYSTEIKPTVKEMIAYLQEFPLAGYNGNLNIHKMSEEELYTYYKLIKDNE